ncbi:hypothetical protein Z043_108109 [Scleropages formosus]|uniref:A-kinase anchor protein 13-like n=1 Tax=Scleropages formosus TaxID=113540 RepID=A0A0P7YXC3_SCLFO|nr:hypothetical protein Z043_108109 [Scleropages formosus]
MSECPSILPESPRCEARQSVDSSLSVTRQDSCSDTDGIFSPHAIEDNVFKKGEEAVTRTRRRQVWLSCSSTGAAGGTTGGSEAVRGGEAEEEEKDRLTEVPLRAAILRSSIRSLSPFRRHSWGPGKNAGGEAEMNQRRSVPATWPFRPSPVVSDVSGKPQTESATSACPAYSLEGLIPARDGGKDFPQRSTSSQEPRRSSRLDSEERGSLVSLTEEEQESDLADCSSLDSQKSGRLHLLRRSSPSMTLPLTKSVSMLAISQKELDGERTPRAPT